MPDAFGLARLRAAGTVPAAAALQGHLQEQALEGNGGKFVSNLVWLCLQDLQVCLMLPECKPGASPRCLS